MLAWTHSCRCMLLSISCYIYIACNSRWHRPMHIPNPKPYASNYLGLQSIAKERCPWEEVALDGQSSHTNCHPHWILGIREADSLRCMSAFGFRATLVLACNFCGGAQGIWTPTTSCSLKHIYVVVEDVYLIINSARWNRLAVACCSEIDMH